MLSSCENAYGSRPHNSKPSPTRTLRLAWSPGHRDRDGGANRGFHTARGRNRDRRRNALSRRTASRRASADERLPFHLRGIRAGARGDRRQPRLSGHWLVQLATRSSLAKPDAQTVHGDLSAQSVWHALAETNDMADGALRSPGSTARLRRSAAEAGFGALSRLSPDRLSRA
jgi:hypothetical protein